MASSREDMGEEQNEVDGQLSPLRATAKSTYASLVRALYRIDISAASRRVPASNDWRFDQRA
jgi:hypothetical protein